MTSYENTLTFARRLDMDDALHSFRHKFIFPPTKAGERYLYFCGNSLGLQPVTVRDAIDQELQDWGHWGVEGHVHAHNPWVSYHERLTPGLARLVGATQAEVVPMNSLTVNVHLLMVSFYRPTAERYKILVEGNAFPSDQYAVDSQIRFHGFDPASAYVELKPRAGETTLRTEDILATIEREGCNIALIMLGGVNYYTGQAFDMAAITQAGHRQGCVVGFDLAHAAGNLRMHLHDWGVDFAAWCSYKYLNAGPGGIAAAFVHEKHHKSPLPRFEGWWGHNKADRFAMPRAFSAIPTAESWQLSNPPIFQLAALKASLDIFDEAGIDRLRQKSERLTGYLEYLLKSIPGEKFEILTPSDPQQRGAQISVRIFGNLDAVQKQLLEQGIICDLRRPDVIRIAPAPLYNSFEDVFRFSEIFKKSLA